MPGFELIGKSELKEVKEIFTKSNGVLFAHGFEKKKKNIFRVRKFENQISKVFKSKYVQCVSSGTAAIKIALKSAGVRHNDEVITQGFNFIATIEAIVDCGAHPIITGINDDLNLDINHLKKLVTKKTKAIILVHMLGYAGEIDKIISFCKKKKITLIEDNCEAIGATFKNKYLGTLGDIGVFSFDFGKNITTGEGGCLLTNNKKKYLFFKQYHDHGNKLLKHLPRGNDKAAMAGFNYRMTELQAAVGIAQLKKIHFIVRENKKRFDVLNNFISKKSYIRKIYKGSSPSYDTFLFKVEKNKKKIIVNLLNKVGIGTKNLPDAIKWHFAFYWKHAVSKKQLKNTESSKKILDEYIAIPILLKKKISLYKEIGQKINSLI